MRTLITGGVKSGKSRFALALAEEFGDARSFLATATGFDEEMRERIRNHKAERAGRFETIEEPIAIHERLREGMVLDCLPMWMNNLFFEGREAEFAPILTALVERMPRDIVIVTNEVGWGFIPPDPMSRRYGELLAQANGRIAAACDRVVLMVAGIPFAVKGCLP
jgi:adenosylcobinamide kinase / adenosylcobinamide-phosphate guanylyltransferase